MGKDRTALCARIGHAQAVLDELAAAARRAVAEVARASRGVEDIWREEYGEPFDPDLHRLRELNDRLGASDLFAACHRLERLFGECIYDPNASTIS